MYLLSHSFSESFTSLQNNPIDYGENWDMASPFVCSDAEGQIHEGETLEITTGIV